MLAKPLANGDVVGRPVQRERLHGHHQHHGRRRSARPARPATRLNDLWSGARAPPPPARSAPPSRATARRCTGSAAAPPAPASVRACAGPAPTGAWTSRPAVPPTVPRSTIWDCNGGDQPAVDRTPPQPAAGLRRRSAWTPTTTGTTTGTKVEHLGLQRPDQPAVAVERQRHRHRCPVRTVPGRHRGAPPPTAPSSSSTPARATAIRSGGAPERGHRPQLAASRRAPSRSCQRVTALPSGSSNLSSVITPGLVVASGRSAQWGTNRDRSAARSATPRDSVP